MARDVSLTPSDPIRDQLFRQLTWGEIDLDYLKKMARHAKAEDMDGVGLKHISEYHGDLTTRALPIEGDATGSAHIIAKEALRPCGLLFLQIILDCYGKGCTVSLKAKDGEPVPAGTCLAEVTGPIMVLLAAERVLLNFLQHLSGIATQTAKFVQTLGDSETKLLDTRKTTPGFRVLEKYAVACGGAWNHRIGLFDRIMLKDNHFAVLVNDCLPKVKEMVRSARRDYPGIAVEIEVDAVENIVPALVAEPDIILLDNFSVPDIKKALEIINKQVYTEASGNVNLDTLPELAHLGLDFISCGALVHQARWCDISMDWNIAL